MVEDSPPFIVIRTPPPAAKPEAKLDPYEQGLELIGVVHRIIGNAATRFYLKDRLDRATTGLVFELGRARTQVTTVRWRNIREAQAHATDCATVLDILVHQAAAPAEDLERARTLVRELIASLASRPNG